MRRRLYPDRVVNYRTLVRDNLNFTDHVQRTLVTASCIAFTGAETVCDPAVGDGTVMEAAHRLRPIKKAWVSDLSEPNINRLSVSFPHQKAAIDIATALRSLPEKVDTIVLTEILEHLEDPDEIVRLAREKATWLVASSPVEEPEGVVNPEHLWSFGRDGYREMLVSGGWVPVTYTETLFPDDPRLYYAFQVWACR